MIRKYAMKFICAALIICFILCGAAYADNDELPLASLFEGVFQYKAEEDPLNAGSFILTPLSAFGIEAELHFYSGPSTEVPINDIATIEDLQKLTLTVAPPDGYFVNGIVFFSGSDYSWSDKDFDMVSLCSASADSADLTLDLSQITPESFGKKANEDYKDAYKIAVLLGQLPSTILYEYDFSSGEYQPVDFSLTEPLNGTYTDSFKLNTISSDADVNYIKSSGYRFGGWKVTYANGAYVILAPDKLDSFHPVLSFKAAPLSDKEIVVVLLKDRSLAFTGTLPSGEKYELPEDGSKNVTDHYTVICKSEDIRPAEIETVLSDFAAVNNDFQSDIGLKSLNLSVKGNADPTVYDGSFPDFIYVYPATLTMTKAPLTITAKSASAVYDGNALTCPEIEDPAGLLGDNYLDPASISVTGSRIDVGTSDNIASGARIFSDNTSSVDFTQFYSITYVPGTLSITKPEPKSIVISPAKDPIGKTFRGEGLTPDASGSPYYILSGELYPTDSILVYSSLYSSPVWVDGSFDYIISDYTISRNNLPLQNPEDYYSITIDNSESGLLTVRKYSISITADSFSKPYDGKEITKNSYAQTGELYEGDKLSVSIAPAQSLSKVGKIDNLVTSCVITDATGKDVSSYYDLTTNSGLLEIAPRPLTITVNDIQKEYNGQTQSPGSNDITLSNPLPNSSDSKFRYEMSLDTVGSLKDIGTTNTNVQVNKIVLIDSSLNQEIDDVTDQFSITIVPGKLTITPRTLTIKTRSVSMQYTGSPLTDSSTPTITGKLEGDKITIKFTGSQTKVGSSNNVCTVTKIVNASGEDVLKNYNIVYNYGKLTVYSASGTNGAPLTGDANHPVLYICLAAATAVGLTAIFAVLIKTRKIKEK